MRIARLFKKEPLPNCWRRDFKSWTALVKFLNKMKKEGIIDTDLVMDLLIEPHEKGYTVHIHALVGKGFEPK